MFADSGTFSGQREASHLIYSRLDSKFWKVGLIRMPGLIRIEGATKGTLSYLIRLIKAWFTFIYIRWQSDLLLHVNLGQTWIALLRDGLPIILFLSSKRDKRVIVSLHGSNFMYWNRDELITKYFRLLIRNVEIITVLGPHQFAKCMDLGISSSKLRIVNNTCSTIGISTEEVVQKHTRLEPVELLHLSSLIDSKGYPQYLEALLKLGQTSGPKICAVVCGRLQQSPFATRFSSLLQARAWLIMQLAKLDHNERIIVRWIQGAEGIEKWALYCKASIFVFPTSYKVEAQPIVLIEAMANGCAIITTDVGEIKAMFAGYDAAVFLVDTTPEHVATAIDELIKDPPRRLRLGLNARRIFEERFAGERYSAAWTTLLMGEMNVNYENMAVRE